MWHNGYYILLFLYFDICNYICFDTSYYFLALSLLLKYSLFFSVTPVLTSSIDVVCILLIGNTFNVKINHPHSRISMAVLSSLFTLGRHRRLALNHWYSCRWFPRFLISFHFFIIIIFISFCKCSYIESSPITRFNTQMQFEKSWLCIICIEYDKPMALKLIYPVFGMAH